MKNCENNVSVNSKHYHPPGNPPANFQKLSNFGHLGRFFRQTPGRAGFPGTLNLNPPGTKGFGTHTKHQGGVEKDPPSISRTRNATNLKPLEGLGVSFKVSKNFKLV